MRGPGSPAGRVCGMLAIAATHSTGRCNNEAGHCAPDKNLTCRGGCTRAGLSVGKVKRRQRKPQLLVGKQTALVITILNIQRHSGECEEHAVGGRVTKSGGNLGREEQRVMVVTPQAGTHAKSKEGQKAPRRKQPWGDSLGVAAETPTKARSNAGKSQNYNSTGSSTERKAGRKKKSRCQKPGWRRLVEEMG